jgi:hypothetical protein
MPVTFSYIHNTRTKQVIFDIVDMEYPYNAINVRGTLNAFEDILHPAYLCMKIPSKQGPIVVHGSQEAARRAEGSWTDSNAIHNIDETEAYQQYKHKREKLLRQISQSLCFCVLLYVAASHAAVSATLVQEKQDGQTKKQAPVYFVSDVLSPSKRNYTELEKVLYAVLMASRKLRHYFQAYHIIVPSSQPSKDIMRNREATGRVGKWAAELNGFIIDYVHRSSK